MHNRRTNKANIIYHVLLVINVLLWFGMTVIYFQAQKPYRAVESHEFDEEFSEARNLLNNSNWDFPQVMSEDYVPQAYWNWDMVILTPNKFGYQECYTEDEMSVSFILGNFYGTEVITVKIPNAYGVRVIEITDVLSSDNSIILEDKIHEGPQYISFCVNGKKYLVNNSLKVWKLESPFEEWKIVKCLKKMI